MKFVLVLLSFVVFTYAGPITFGTGKQVTIDEDGTITVTSGTGKKIVITKAIGHPGPKDIEITVGGPHGPTKKIEIDGETQTRTVDIMDNEYENLNEEEREKRSNAKESKSGKSKSKKSQSDVLSKIFKQYEGVVDAESYNELLANINNSVQNGELNPAVYNVLQSLNQYRLAEKYGNQGYLVANGFSSGNQFQSQLPLQQERWVSGQIYNNGQFPLSQQQSVSEQQLQQQFQQQLKQEQVQQQLQQLQQLRQQVQLQQQFQQQQPGFNPSQLRSVVEQLVNPWY